LEDRFDVVPVGVDDEGGIVVGVVALAQAWGPVITPPLARAAAWKFRTASRSEATKARSRSTTPEEQREVYHQHRVEVHIEEDGEPVLTGLFGERTLCTKETPS
jgi:hypothetical protein